MAQLWLVILLALACACDKQPNNSAGPAQQRAGSAGIDAAVVDAGELAGSGSGSAGTGSASTALAVGDRVYGKWENGEWYPGKIERINADGTYRVKYTDGDVSPKLPRKHVRARTAVTGSSSSSSRASSGGSKCGSGYTDCRGWCVELRSNNSNCGRCGNSCRPSQICREGVCDCTSFAKDANGGVCPPP